MSISALICNTTGKLITDAIGKTNNLNSQFQSVFTTETPLTDNHRNPQAYPDIADMCFTNQGILVLLQDLDPSKAVYAPRVLKELALSIASALTEILNHSYRTGKMTQDWRNANVVPAYKEGKTHLR